METEAEGLDISQNRERFTASVQLALADVFNQYKGRKLLRPKINACLEDKFGVRSREVNLHIPEDGQSFSVRFLHPEHGEMTFEV